VRNDEFVLGGQGGNCGKQSGPLPMGIGLRKVTGLRFMAYPALTDHTHPTVKAMLASASGSPESATSSNNRSGNHLTPDRGDIGGNERTGRELRGGY
jgi:hypothetical protein